MGIGTGAAIIGGIAAPIAGAAISSNAATTAAGDQSAAANQAAQLQYNLGEQSLGVQQNEFNTQQAELQPFLQSGTGATANLDYLLGVTPQTASGATATPSSASSTPSGVRTGPQPGVTQSPGNLNGLNNTSQPFTPSVGAIQNENGSTSAPLTGTPTTTQPAQPFAASGSGVQGGYGSLLQPYGQTFTAPTAEQALNSPGEQAQLKLGEQAMQQSAAAQGNLLTGGTLQALDAYGQNLASTNYQNTYNNAYNTYAAGYNQYEQQQANEYNRLAALAGAGQTTASTLGSLGQSNANATSNTLSNTGSQVGQQLNNAAAANASGIVGSANAWSGAIGGTSSNLNNLLLLSQLAGGTTTDSTVSSGVLY